MVEYSSSFTLDFGKEMNKTIYSQLKEKKEYDIILKEKLLVTINQPSLAKLRAITNSLLRDLTIITRINSLIEESD